MESFKGIYETFWQYISILYIEIKKIKEYKYEFFAIILVMISFSNGIGLQTRRLCNTNLYIVTSDLGFKDLSYSSESFTGGAYYGIIENQVVLVHWNDSIVLVEQKRKLSDSISNYYILEKTESNVGWPYKINGPFSKKQFLEEYQIRGYNINEMQCYYPFSRTTETIDYMKYSLFPLSVIVFVIFVVIRRIRSYIKNRNYRGG